jgi:hypothetical protein
MGKKRFMGEKKRFLAKIINNRKYQELSNIS